MVKLSVTFLITGLFIQTALSSGLLAVTSPSPSPPIPTPAPPADFTESTGTSDLPLVSDSAPTTTIDKSHAYLSRLLTETVYSFNQFFGDEDIEEEMEKPWLKIKGSVEWKENWKFVFAQRFRTSIPLPVLEQKLHTVFGSTADDDLESDPDYEDREEDDHFTAGLRYFFGDIKNISSSFTIGAQLRSGIVVYAKPRLEWEISPHPYNIQVVQYLLWYSDERQFGEKTNVYLNRLIGKRWLVSSQSEAKYANTTQGMDLSQEFDLQYLDLSKKGNTGFAASLEWQSDAHTWPDFQTDRHQLRLRVRQAVWRRWLRLEISPRLTWQREYPDEGISYWKYASPSLLVSVEFLFEEME